MLPHVFQILNKILPVCVHAKIRLVRVILPMHWEGDSQVR